MWLQIRIKKLFDDKVINRRVTVRGREQHSSPKERPGSAAGKRQKAALAKYIGMRTDGWEHAASTALRIHHKKKLPSFTLIPHFYFLSVQGKKKKDVTMKATQVEL